MDQNYFSKFININSPLLITGETGTGKSFIAKKIFESSKINKDLFLTAHLASLKDDLIESELYGHKKGAFTGAFDFKNGYLKDVGRGTLFLDEIGELSLESQKKLLYLLEEKKFTPLGSTHSLDFNGRIIMATNKNLKSMVDQGLFREDLFYRIAVFELKLPALRDDITNLRSSIDTIFEELKGKYKKECAYLSDEAIRYLLQEKWKGNYRELRNSLEFALAMGGTAKIEVADFPLILKSPEKKIINFEDSILDTFPLDYAQSIELFEKMYLKAVLEKSQGKINETARRLGMSKTTLIYKAKKYHINTLKIRADASINAA